MTEGVADARRAADAVEVLATKANTAGVRFYMAATQESGAISGGPEQQMSSKLHRTYLDAGLPEPQLRLEAPVGGGEYWPGYAYVADTVRSLLPMLEAMGAATAEEVQVDTLADRLRGGSRPTRGANAANRHRGLGAETIARAVSRTCRGTTGGLRPRAGMPARR
jgi:hypothetical protein